MKKKKLSISIKTENAALLKWLNLNYSDKASFIIDELLTRYYSRITAEMTDFEKEQVKNLKVVMDNCIFDKKKIEQVRIKAFDLAFEEKLISILDNKEKREKLKELLNG